MFAYCLDSHLWVLSFGYSSLYFTLQFFRGWSAFLSIDTSIAITVLCRSSFAMHQPSCDSVAYLVFKLFQFKQQNWCDEQTDRQLHYSDPLPTGEG